MTPSLTYPFGTFPKIHPIWYRDPSLTPIAIDHEFIDNAAIDDAYTNKKYVQVMSCFFRFKPTDKAIRGSQIYGQGFLSIIQVECDPWLAFVF